MQSLLVLALLIFVTAFGTMEFQRVRLTTNDLANERADLLAENLLQYNNLLVSYALSNYDDGLHFIRSSQPGSVEGVTIINYSQISQYTQINFTPFLDYQSIAFNYAVASESDSTPMLYLASSWESTVVKSFSNIKIPEMLGATNQILTKSLYQGDSTYWTIPLLVSQENCNINEIYSQIPTDVNGDSQLNQVKTMFYKFCIQIQNNSLYKFLTYVFLEPVFKTAI